MQQPPKPITAFTLKSNGGLLNVLISDIVIHVPDTRTSVAVKAIWDTGATGSVITQKVINQLALFPTGVSTLHTANGIANRNSYTVDIGLPNRVLIQKVNAAGIDALSSGCDALI